MTSSRCSVAPCAEADVAMYFELWNDPRVMRFVGFPHGLRISSEKIP